MAEEFTIAKRLWWLAHVIFQQCTAIVVFNILWTVYEKYNLDSLSAWHIILCTLGYAFFMGEAVVLFASNSVLTLNINRLLKGQIHGILMGCGTILLTIGMSMKVYQKNDYNSEHFQTTHAILGLVSWILTFVAVFIGILVANATKIRNFIRPVYVKFLHNGFGMFAYVLGIASLCYGVDKFSRSLYMSDNTVLLTNILLGIITGYNLIGGLLSAYEQISQIFNR